MQPRGAFFTLLRGRKIRPASVASYILSLRMLLDRETGQLSLCRAQMPGRTLFDAHVG